VADPKPKPPKRQRISYYLPPDLVEAVNAEALADAPHVTSGRVFNPSAVVERILRAHYEKQPKRSQRAK
jgi:hypothetical protein